MRNEEIGHWFKRRAAEIRAEGGETARFRATAFETTAQKFFARPGVFRVAQLAEMKLTERTETLVRDIAAGRVETRRSIAAELTGVLGVGREKAAALVAAGVKSLADLRKKKYAAMLPEVSRLALQLKPQRIPREVTDQFADRIADTVDRAQRWQIVGSYRRGRPDSGDLDLMLIGGPDSFDWLLERMRPFYETRVYERGVDQLSMFFRALDREGPYYQLDAFRVDPAHEAAMLLYSTGSADHNIRMRAAAKKKGLRLNQEGVYRDGRLIPTRTEEEIFRLVGMPYVEPEKR